MNLGKRLKSLRECNGLSQEELAKKLNISRQSISKWELDKSYPDTENLVFLSEIYNITIDELVKETNELNINEKYELKPYKREYEFLNRCLEIISNKNESRKKGLFRGILFWSAGIDLIWSI